MTLAWPDPMPFAAPVQLRPFRESDLSLVQDLSADPYIPQITSVPAVFTREEGLAYIARQHQRLRDGTGWSFAIADAQTDEPVGQIGLWLRGPGRARAGYVVSPFARRRGSAAAALNALTAFGWTVPGLRRIEVFMEPWNVGSRRVAERAGYVAHGLRPEQELIGGVRRDMLLYASERAGRSRP